MSPRRDDGMKEIQALRLECERLRQLARDAADMET